MRERTAVLVVDDDDAIRRLVSRVLARHQYETAEAVDGQDALEKLRMRPYDVLVLDLMMPVMNGFEVIRYITANDDAGMPCVIVLSAAGTRDLADAAAMGVHAVIHKPFDLPVLITAVDECSAHAQRNRG
jgi:CheY-like chemotaxis protein